MNFQDYIFKNLKFPAISCSKIQDKMLLSNDELRIRFLIMHRNA